MEDIQAFLAVIEAGSQTAAARQLGRSLQSVNRSLAALEHDVGVELVRRTTRRSFATEAGLAFYRRVKPALAEISEARLEAASRRVERAQDSRTGSVRFDLRPAGHRQFHRALSADRGRAQGLRSTSRCHRRRF